MILEIHSYDAEFFFNLRHRKTLTKLPLPQKEQALK